MRLWFRYARDEHVLGHVFMTDLDDLKQIFSDHVKYTVGHEQVPITEVICDGGQLDG